MVYWILLGSICTNILWIYRYQRILDDFYYWKQEKNKNYKDYQYINGILLGLLLGPLVLHFVKRQTKGCKNEKSISK